MTPRPEADPLGATKFVPPRSPPGWVERPRLAQALEQGLRGPVTLLAASAGAGKSALLSAWYAQHTGAKPVCWLSLDTSDADRRRFWRGVFAALRRGGAGEPAASLALHPAEDIGIAIPALVNALDRLEDPVVLVLDDLHELGDSPVLDDLDRLLRHPPENLRLVISTRMDPALRIGRLRVEGALTEIREADLAFTLDESVALLHASGIELEPEVGRRLWTRTEGWAAGLRLAALTLRGHPDPPAFVDAFAGDDIATADYLLTEVLARQPPELADFLLRTSIVDTVHADLADALTGRAGAPAVLARLEREHALITVVEGNARTWHRYHRLLRELLQVQLRFRLPGEVPGLHRTAAAWYAANARPAEAIRHAAAGEAWDMVAALASEHWLPLLVAGEIPSLRPVLESLPEARVAEDAELALAMAAVMLDAGDGAQGAELLTRAHALRDTVPRERSPRFTGGLAMVGLLAARVSGDPDAARWARDAIEGTGSDALPAGVGRAVRAYATLNLGITELWTGRLEPARRELEGARRAAEAAGAAWIKLLALSHLAASSAMAGEVRRAQRLGDEALAHADEHGWSRTWAAGMAETALSAVALERDELGRARSHFARGGELLAQANDAPLRAGGLLHAARLQLAGGQPDAALLSLERYPDALGDWPLFDELRGLGAGVRARALAALGHHDEGVESLEEAGDLLRTGHAVLALAHLRLLSGDADAALEVLGRRLDDPPRTPLGVELLLLAALAHDARADHAAASVCLEHALRVSEPEGMRRPFATLGPSVRGLLRRQIRLGTAHRSLVDDLLEALERPSAGAGERTALTEVLSDRELAVLRFLPTMMSNTEIAAELFVSVNTVKSHLKSIYRKLDVPDRRHAVRRARDLSLLAP
ncbi:MAG TPA: LuxR C-terminal-related transcriptional regulator [Solirubrobacteraceae bacterium]|nr:LuxR C-terminal-related transcriptional regulator [Solirubrobacteraceae bacterium]